MRGIPSPIAACRAAPMTPTPSPDLSLAAAWRGLMAACGPTLAYLVLALWALLLALMPAAVVLAAAAGGAVLVALASPPAAAAAMAVGAAGATGREIRSGQSISSTVTAAAPASSAFRAVISARTVRVETDSRCASSSCGSNTPFR